MKKIIAVVGARPQFIKLAPFIAAAKDQFSVKIVHTGQHYDHQMSESFFIELGIPEPDYNLGVGSMSGIKQIANILIQFEDIVLAEKPDAIVVFGDTNSTAAAAITAVKLNIRLVHIEAGLREFDKTIPEETNKLITDILSDIFFSPTETGVTNLKNTGLTNHVYNVGDIALDLVYKHATQINTNTDVLKKFGIESKKYSLATCHRVENTDNESKLTEILKGFSALDHTVLFLVHPRTRAAIAKFKLEKLIGANVKLEEPVGFLDTQILVKNAKYCLTDSGGIIKETYFHKTPGIIIDTQTEWVETVAEGWNRIAGPDSQKIADFAKHFTTPPTHNNVLGNGDTSEKIVSILKKVL